MNIVTRISSRTARPRPAVRPALEALEDRCLMAAGVLDAGFNSAAVAPLAAGKQAFGLLGPTDYAAASALAVQADGKIVVAGVFDYHKGSNEDFAVARLNADGTLDKTFGIYGRTVLSFGGTTNFANAVAIQSDGKIVVAGYTDASGNPDFAVARLNADGSLDTSFNGSGRQTVAFDLGGSKDDEANGVAIDASGKIVLAGYATLGATDTDFAFARLTPTGALDTTFNGTGKQLVAFNLGGGNVDQANGVAIQSDGGIVAAGYAQTGAASYQFASARLTANGALDTGGFNAGGTPGKVAFGFGAATDDDEANAVTLQSDGKIVVAGYTASSSTQNQDFAVARLQTNGTLDPSFNGGGRQVLAFNPGGPDDAVGLGVTVQADGKIVVAGTATLSATNADMAVVRLNTDGTPDAAFNGDGKQTVAFDLGGDNTDIAVGVAVTANGKIILAGTAQTPNNFEMAVARLRGIDQTSTAGLYDPRFGTWFLRNSNSAGAPDIPAFQYGSPGWLPIVGDWTGDGVMSIGVFTPATATFYLKNSNSAGAPDYVFAFGPSNVGIPVAGDWDGDGKWGVGVYDPTSGTFYLRNELSSGLPDAGAFQFGPLGSRPVAGDWDGDGKFTVGVFSPATATWYLNGADLPGSLFASYQFGLAGSSLPVAGDWNGDGIWSPGIVTPSNNNSFWQLRNENSAGAPDAGAFSYGVASIVLPVAGDYNFPAPPQLAAGGQGPGAPAITPAQLTWTVTAALGRLRLAGVGAAELAKLSAVTFQLSALPAGQLGVTYADQNRVVISPNGAGHGWFVDPTPYQDEEFYGGTAWAGNPAAGKEDLLTVVLHELGHVAGLTDDDGLPLMASLLPTGTRRTDALDAIFRTYYP